MATATKWVEAYKTMCGTVQRDSQYRIVQPTNRDGTSATMYVDADRRQAVLFQMLQSSMWRDNPPAIHPQGLDPAHRYRVTMLDGGADADKYPANRQRGLLDAGWYSRAAERRFHWDSVPFSCSRVNSLRIASIRVSFDHSRPYPYILTCLAHPAWRKMATNLPVMPSPSHERIYVVWWEAIQGNDAIEAAQTKKGLVRRPALVSLGEDACRQRKLRRDYRPSRDRDIGENITRECPSDMVKRALASRSDISKGELKPDIGGRPSVALAIGLGGVGEQGESGTDPHLSAAADAANQPATARAK